MQQGTVQLLVGFLGQGWARERPGRVDGLVQQLEKRLGRAAEARKFSHSSLCFRMDLGDIHLSGLNDEGPCLIVGGGRVEAEQAVREFLRGDALPSVIPLILCVSSEAYGEALRVVAEVSALVLSPAEVGELLCDDEPYPLLKRWLRRRISRARLNPYAPTRPAGVSMFFGRQEELTRLHQEEDRGFAIAGARSAGKTSLLQRYKWEITRRRDERCGHTFVINCRGCSNTSDGAAARFIADCVDPSMRVDQFGLQECFRTRHNNLGWPTELLLDDVDELCTGAALRSLSDAAREGHLRLILSGREDALQQVLDRGTSSTYPFELIRLGPLDPQAAEDIICKPMADLGIELREGEQLVKHILRASGCWPHLLHLYCSELVKLARESGVDVVSLAEAREVETCLETARCVTAAGSQQ
jgi:hypothetical protein